jgi:hypothetical protein
MKKMIRWALLMLVLPFFLLSCAVKTVSTQQFGSSEGCERRLLIASELTPFKNAVVQQMTHDLDAEYCYIKLVDVSNIQAEPVEAYEAVAVLNSLKYFKINKKARAYLDQTAAKQKFVMLVTTGKAGRQFDVEGIDAISSASTPVDSELVAGQLVTRIMERKHAR